MSASPEFYKPAPAFSPPCGSSPLLLRGAAGGKEEGVAGAVWEQQKEEEEEYYCCRTPPASGVEAPGTCPPAPRKPRAAAAPCKKRLFEVEVFSLRLDELERLFLRPRSPLRQPEKKRRRVVARSGLLAGGAEHELAN